MPTFRVTGPDGATYDVTPPEGTNPSESEILAQVQAQASPAASQAGGIVDTVNAGLKSARDWMQPAANNLVNFAGDVASQFVHPGAAFDASVSGPRSLFNGASPETQAAPSSPAGRFAAEVVNPVPGNITDAGAQAGTVAMGPFGILSRILGGAGGAGIGKALEGGSAADVGKAAGLAGAGNVAGEGLAGGLSFLAKSTPGAVTRIRNQDAARMLEAAPTISPGLGRPGVELGAGTSSERLQQLVTAGKQGLNDAKEEAIQRIEAALQEPRAAMVGGMPQAQGPVGPGSVAPPPEALPPFGQNAARDVPTGTTPDTFWSRFRARGEDPAGPPVQNPQNPSDLLQQRHLAETNAPGAPVPAAPPWQPRSLVGDRGVPLEIPSLGSVTLREANAELTAIGEGLRHAQILDPTMRQREAARAYAALSDEIRQALDAQSPGLGSAFQQAQQQYGAGLDYLKKLASPNNWNPGSQGIEFDSRFLQKDLARNPLKADRTDQRMGDQGMAALTDALTRGEGLGRVDKIPAGGGGIGDAVMEWLRGAKTGTASLPLALIRSGLPNAGAQYIGRKPYTMDPGVKMLIDLGILKGTEAGLPTQPVKIGPVP